MSKQTSFIFVFFFPFSISFCLHKVELRRLFAACRGNASWASEAALLRSRSPPCCSKRRRPGSRRRRFLRPLRAFQLALRRALRLLGRRISRRKTSSSSPPGCVGRRGTAAPPRSCRSPRRSCCGPSSARGGRRASGRATGALHLLEKDHRSGYEIPNRDGDGT